MADQVTKTGKSAKAKKGSRRGFGRGGSGRGGSRREGSRREGSGTAALADYTLLARPVVTEKSSLVNAGEGRSCVVFEVHPKASKTDIRQAIERIFGVTVQAVRTCNNPGKLKARGRTIGRTSDYRKAYVTLAPGQKIDVVEGL